MNTKRDVMPTPVRRVDEQFKRWRSGRQGQERIPPRLWECAARLCETYSVHRVSRWLRLNHTSLQEQARRRRGPGRRSPSKPAFVEWSLPSGIVSGACVAEYVVEVGGRVPRIHVRGASALEVAALVSALGGQGGGA